MNSSIKINHVTQVIISENVIAASLFYNSNVVNNEKV